MPIVLLNSITPGGGGAVDSVFTRTGAVVAATSDYDAIQVDNVLYYSFQENKKTTFTPPYQGYASRSFLSKIDLNTKSKKIYEFNHASIGNYSAKK